MRWFRAGRRIPPDRPGHRNARRSARSRSKRLATRVECLEARSLLSTTLKEFPIHSPSGGGNDTLGAIISGPDRSVWFIDNLGNGEQLGKISPSGSLTWFPVINDPGACNTANHLAIGPDGNVWFNTSDAIGEMTPAGAITLYAVPAIASSVSGLTAGADGNVWFTASPSTGGDISQTEGVVGWITPSGVITTFPILTAPQPNQVATGPIVEAGDGNVWFGRSSRPITPTVIPSSRWGA